MVSPYIQGGIIERSFVGVLKLWNAKKKKEYLDLVASCSGGSAGHRPNLILVNHGREYVEFYFKMQHSRNNSTFVVDFVKLCT